MTPTGPISRQDLPLTEQTAQHQSVDQSILKLLDLVTQYFIISLPKQRLLADLYSLSKAYEQLSVSYGNQSKASSIVTAIMIATAILPFANTNVTSIQMEGLQKSVSIAFQTMGSYFQYSQSPLNERVQTANTQSERHTQAKQTWEQGIQTVFSNLSRTLELQGNILDLSTRAIQA
jgi:hypothetical protein